jgi:ADP-ribosyl-[dinitrogen reductase] hydrolase
MHGDPKDIGNTTRVALRALADGVPPVDAGAVALLERGEEGAASNGAVMRCAPIALRFRQAPEELVRASLDSARVTHAEPRASWACVAVNQAIVHLLAGGDIHSVPQTAVAGVGNDEIRATVLGAAGRAKDEVRARGFVLDTIGAAFWSLAHGENARDAIELAVAFGDDADSTGAVTGAMAGAFYGASALPASWVEHVQFRERLEGEAARLLALADGESR